MTAPTRAIALKSGGSNAAVVFDAILHPNRSLGRRGFAILMVAAAAISVTLGAALLIAGAWPVAGLYGLELAILYGAFRASYHDGRRYEKVRLTADRLTVERIDPSGSRAIWTFQPYWLTVTIDDPTEHHSRIVLSSHGRSLVVGSFLSPDERLEFANALRMALDRAKEPSWLRNVARTGLAGGP